MQPTRDARTAKRKLFELGITSATVLTGSTTITLDLSAFDALCASASATAQPFDCDCRARAMVVPRPDCPIHGVDR